MILTKERLIEEINKLPYDKFDLDSVSWLHDLKYNAAISLKYKEQINRQTAPTPQHFKSIVDKYFWKLF